MSVDDPSHRRHPGGCNGNGGADPGTNGWVGGTGTAAYIDPARDTVSILFTQLELNDPTAPRLMRDFWLHAADLAQ